LYLLRETRKDGKKREEAPLLTTLGPPKEFVTAFPRHADEDDFLKPKELK